MNDDFEFDSLVKKMAAEHQPELPSPGLIWWRAQVLKKQADRERIERPFAIMRTLVAVLCVVVVAALWTGQADGIRAILGRISVFPFESFVIVALLIGIGCVGLMLWGTSRAKGQT